MTIINLTPHPLVIQRTQIMPALTAGGSPITSVTTETIESSGIARCEQSEEVVGQIDGIPVVRTRYGTVTGLPEEKPVCTGGCGLSAVSQRYCECGGSYVLEIAYVVSAITAQAVPHRSDVFVPARLIRDDTGRVIACASLGRIAA